MYLNLEGSLEKSLKIKYALKSTGISLKSLNSTIFVGVSTVDRNINQYKRRRDVGLALSVCQSFHPQP